jgi:2-dehydropantoate 2-reductase
MEKTRNMNYAVIGTGGIGGYYGSRLAQNGHDVHFLLHRDYAFVKEHGLQIDSCAGSFHLVRPAIYSDAPASDGPRSRLPHAAPGDA